MDNLINEKDFFIQNFAYRKNILHWLPLKKNKDVLILGSQYGILSECFSDCKVYCVEEDINKNKVNKSKHPNNIIYNYSTDQFLNIYSNMADYIVIDGYLDNNDNKEEIIKKCLNLLKTNGQIFLLSNNKFALRYFAGAKEGINQEFGHLKNTNSLYSKKEWEKLFKKLNINYQFFYPFPNYTFPEFIFKTSPKPGELSFVYSSFDTLRMTYFDENEAYNQIIKSDYFEEFNNSFLIVLNKNIEDISYVKFACERRKEYQIFTTINEINGTKSVIKKPLYNEGIQHLQNMYDFYQDFRINNSNERISYCPVEIHDHNLYFQFIKGVSLETLVYDNVQNGNIDGIKKQLDIINEIVAFGEVNSFELSERFIMFFGERDYHLIENTECYTVNNIDLIFDNVIVNDKYNVIDYEWIVDCLVPKSFILFRTIYHSRALSTLDTKILEELYDYCFISKELRNLYLKMEIHFQEYVSDFKLHDIYKDFNCQMIKPIPLDSRIIRNKIIQNNTIYDYSIIDSKELNISFYIDEQDAILKIEKKAIIRIDCLTIDNQIADFTTNADVIIGNNYYFLNSPEINIVNNNGKHLEIKLFYYYYANDCINDIISLILGNKKLNDRIENLRKHRYVRLIDKDGG